MHSGVWLDAMRQVWQTHAGTVVGQFPTAGLLMMTHIPSKHLTLSQSTWDGIGFVPGLLAGVDTVELVVRLVDTEDLLE